MPETSLIIIGGSLAILLGIFIYARMRRKHLYAGEAQSEYIEGLNYLIAGDNQQALKKLKNTVHIDTDYIDAYIKIGDILRCSGSPENAIKIHKDLLVRPKLSEDQKISIHKSTAQDYKEAKEFGFAIQACEKILEIDKYNKWAKDWQLKMYEQMGDWQGAYDHLRKNNLVPKEQKSPLLACYKLELGKQCASKKSESEAQSVYREALKQDSGCVGAYIELADSLMRENKGDDAVSVLKKLLQVKSELS